MSETQTPEAEAPEGESPKGGDLYEEELNRYRATMNRDLDLSCRRYGFVLYHSLDGKESIQLREKLGFQPVEATDFYNLGVVAAEEENYSEAIKKFKKALDLDSELAAAQFNLALAQDKSGDAAEAKKSYARLLKREDLDEEDREAAQSRLNELG